MAVKTSPPKGPRPLFPPDPSLWQRYSPHNEAPLAGATSFFLHGIVIGLMVVGGMAYFWAARDEAARPAKMDVVMIAPGAGEPEGGGVVGLPGSSDGGGPKRTENVQPSDNLKKPEHNDPLTPPEKPPEPDFPSFESPAAPLDKDLVKELERAAKEAAEKANQQPPTPTPPKSSPKFPGFEGKKPGPKGTGNPKGTGGLGGAGAGTGAGNKFGPGTGKGGMGNITKQQIYAWRWNFNLGSDGKTHAQMLAAIGVNVAVQDPKGRVFFITDLNRRPVDWNSLKKGTLPDPKEVVCWRNTKADSIQALARELKLPFTPVFIQMMLPKEREQAMVDAENRLAASQGRDINTVRRTWFEFQLQNGAFEPVGKRFE